MFECQKEEKKNLKEAKIGLKNVSLRERSHDVSIRISASSDYLECYFLFVFTINTSKY